MDQAMVKRGIGAVVLAVIAALLLGYLLKDKSRERQEVVDMEMPNATELNIPDLSGSNNNNTDNKQQDTISIVGDAPNSAKNSVENTVVASADAVSNGSKNVRESFNNVTNIVTNIDPNPGFSIRPPNQNETREINDNNTSGAGSAAISHSPDPVDEVIASSKKQQAKPFKPTIVEEKKKPKPVKKTKPPKASQKPANKAVAKTAPKQQKSTTAKPAANAQAGKYSIQLLATSSQSRAGKLANTMKSEGYNVFVTQTHSNNKILFRVRVGGHADRNSAIKVQESMKRRYQKNFFVQNSLVIRN